MPTEYVPDAATVSELKQKVLKFLEELQGQGQDGRDIAEAAIKAVLELVCEQAGEDDLASELDDLRALLKV